MDLRLFLQKFLRENPVGGQQVEKIGRGTLVRLGLVVRQRLGRQQAVLNHKLNRLLIV